MTMTTDQTTMQAVKQIRRTICLNVLALCRRVTNGGRADRLTKSLYQCHTLYKCTAYHTCRASAIKISSSITKLLVTCPFQTLWSPDLCSFDGDSLNMNT